MAVTMLYASGLKVIWPSRVFPNSITNNFCLFVCLFVLLFQCGFSVTELYSLYYALLSILFLFCLLVWWLSVPVNSDGHVGTLSPFYGTSTA